MNWRFWRRPTECMKWHYQPIPVSAQVIDDVLKEAYMPAIKDALNNEHPFWAYLTNPGIPQRKPLIGPFHQVLEPRVIHWGVVNHECPVVRCIDREFVTASPAFWNRYDDHDCDYEY